MREHKSVREEEVTFSTFTHFPQLPLELRLQIWSYAIHEGVYIHFYRRPSYHLVSQHLIARCSDHPVPPMLHTNAEARSVAFPHYEILGTGPSRIYFNPAIDTLMVGMIFRANFAALISDPETILGENVTLLQHIAVYLTPFYSDWFARPMLENFPDLESFSVLNLKDWESALGRQRTMDDAGNGIDYDGLREALGPEVLRAESLDRVSDEHLRLREFRHSMALARAAWKGLSNRPLDVKIMKLPFSGPTRMMFEERRAKRPCKLPLDMYEESETEEESVAKKGRGGWFRSSPIFRKIFSKFCYRS